MIHQDCVQDQCCVGFNSFQVRKGIERELRFHYVTSDAYWNCSYHVQGYKELIFKYTWTNHLFKNNIGCALLGTKNIK